MPKCRKKPVVVEFWQFTIDSFCNVGSMPPEWFRNALLKDDGAVGHVRYIEKHPMDGAQCLIIATLEGNHRANVGDFIIQGVKGEMYPCKPDIFEMTYDIIEPKASAASAEREE